MNKVAIAYKGAIFYTTELDRVPYVGEQMIIDATWKTGGLNEEELNEIRDEEFFTVESVCTCLNDQNDTVYEIDVIPFCYDSEEEQ